MASKVFHIHLGKASAQGQEDAAARLMAALGAGWIFEKADLVAIKVHVGEKRNTTHMRPEIVAAAVSVLKDAGAEPFVTDTATLYKGERQNGVRHAFLAAAHGFGLSEVGAPFIPVDGISGNYEREVQVGGELHETVRIAGDTLLADGLVVVTHATGHPGSGLGGAIKNVGMGLASRAGKMRQHSTVKPEVKPNECEGCGKCRKWCPADAIGEREGMSYIAADKCIGCGECIAVCRFGAMVFNWGVESPLLQKAMAEHAAGALRHFGKKALFLTSLMDMTAGCDCYDREQKPVMEDLGLLASADIVALDQATLDITGRAAGVDLSRKSNSHLDPEVQIAHAEKMGLGSRRHELIELDPG